MISNENNIPILTSFRS